MRPKAFQTKVVLLVTAVVILVLLTYNYDGILSQHIGLRTATRTQTANVRSVGKQIPVNRHMDRTNILFILADDMGVWAAGTYGNPEIHTPNIDKLADEGLKFTNAFCNTPVCSASRASILTGRLPTQNGVLDHLQRKGRKGCDDEPIEYLSKEITYTDILSKHGYYCALSGKYHLGYDSMAQHSFKHWYTFGSGVYTNPVMFNNSNCFPTKGYSTDIFTDGAIDFLNSYIKNESTSPFYLSVHYTAPHSPYIGKDGRADSVHPKEYVDMYKDPSFVSCPSQKMAHRHNYLTNICSNNHECLKGYYAAVTAMDMNIGRIMDALCEHNLDRSTLVVFTSDHGFLAGHHGLWGKGNAAYPLNVYETSIRIPMIWRHSGTIEPGVDESVVQVLDIAPTLLDYAGNFIFPKAANLPGESFADLLLQPSKRNSRKTRTIYGEYGATRYSRINATTKYVSRLTGNEKLEFDHDQELYDLIHDVNETVNLVFSSKFMQKYSKEIEYYEQSLQEWFSQYQDPVYDTWRKAVGGKGQHGIISYKYDGSNRESIFDKF